MLPVFNTKYTLLEGIKNFARIRSSYTHGYKFVYKNIEYKLFINSYKKTYTIVSNIIDVHIIMTNVAIDEFLSHLILGSVLSNYEDFAKKYKKDDAISTIYFSSK